MIKLIGIIVVGVATLVGVASRWIFKKTDNVVEEISEQVIKKETGYNIDLSPDTEDPELEIPLVDTIIEIVDDATAGLDNISVKESHEQDKLDK